MSAEFKVPEFKSQEEELKYWERYDGHLIQFLTALNKVKDEMYGKGTGNFSNIPASCVQVMVGITERLIYDTNDDYTSEEQNNSGDG